MPSAQFGMVKDASARVNGLFNINGDFAPLTIIPMTMGIDPTTYSSLHLLFFSFSVAQFTWSIEGAGDVVLPNVAFSRQPVADVNTMNQMVCRRLLLVHY